MSRFTRRSVFKILLGLGLCLAFQVQARAQYGPYPAYPPAPYYPAVPMMPYAPPPMMPYAPPPVLPPQAPASPPAAPAPAPEPAPTKPAPGKPAPGKPAPAKPAPAPAKPAKPCDPETAHTEAEFAHHAVEDHCPPSVGINILGRGDFLNRFNIFDNMSALPQDRVWFDFQSLDRFNTGLGQLGLRALPLTQRRVVYLYRGGAEVILGGDVSFVAQGEYVASGGTMLAADAWSNPQVMLKWAVLNTDTTTISPVLAFSPETSQTQGELHERVSRLTPGVLAFQTLPFDFFFQAGMQFNIALGTGASTFDYALSLGGWLYRHESLSPSGRTTDPYDRAAFPFVTGVSAQAEMLAKHVLGHATRIPFDPNNPVQVGFYPGYAEPSNVYDFTTGVTVVLFNHATLSAAYSRPISGPRVRDNEVMCILNIHF